MRVVGQAAQHGEAADAGHGALLAMGDLLDQLQLGSLQAQRDRLGADDAIGGARRPARGIVWGGLGHGGLAVDSPLLVSSSDEALHSGIESNAEICLLQYMTEEIRLSVGARLREERERLGFSQSAFGQLAGVSLRTEQDWERGVSSVRADFLSVAATHGVDVLYVLTGQRTQPVESTLTPEERALLDNYQHSDEEARRSARLVLNALARRKAA